MGGTDLLDEPTGTSRASKMSKTQPKKIGGFSKTPTKRIPLKVSRPSSRTKTPKTQPKKTGGTPKLSNIPSNISEIPDDILYNFDITTLSKLSSTKKISKLFELPGTQR